MFDTKKKKKTLAFGSDFKEKHKTDKEKTFNIWFWLT